MLKRNNKITNEMYEYFHPVEKDSFFINSRSIHSKDQIVTTGKTYIIYESSGENSAAFKLVELIDATIFLNMLMILLKDLKSNQILFRMHLLSNPEEKSIWVLADLDEVSKRI